MAKRGGADAAAITVLLSAKSELWQSCAVRIRRHDRCCYQRKVNYGKARRGGLRGRVECCYQRKVNYGKAGAVDAAIAAGVAISEK